MELFNERLEGREADIYRPLMAYLRDKNKPYIPRWDLMPLHKQCRLALLWKEAGFTEEAGRLASWLLKLEPFPSLWCPEKEFDEQMISRCFANLRDIEPIEVEGYDCNLTLIQTPKMSAAFTLDGFKTSLGVIHAGVEIRAFGPQAGLSFGIAGKGMNGWARVAAYPEVWVEMKDFNFRFVGVKPENPLSLAFYVKAESCEIGNEMLKPKSLRRFVGETTQVRFGKKTIFDTNRPFKVEVIPLAGENCFWGTDFLLNYFINPFDPQISIRIA